MFTTRNGATAPRANDALCVEVEGTDDTRLALEFECRTSKSLLATATDWQLTGKLGGSKRDFSIGELLRGRQGWRVDGLPTSIVAHRAMPEVHYALAGRFVEPAVGPDFTTCVQPRTTANWPGAARSDSRAKTAFYRRVSWQV